ncbi:Integrase core domain protein [Caloramator mitchellensis]|uniref:Integrase core domain protein n=2 Tax=Caloramator mitchellensis TaxID=908809 RepID=A0A0R3JRZ6_CALMK|nr:Integrase core domain protein [Caloramator mitchellensis]
MLKRGCEGMITLMNKQQIILAYFNEGKALRAIARETGIDRKTVRKYVRDYEEKRRQLFDSNKISSSLEIIDAIVEEPKYDSSNRGKKKLNDEIIARIKFYLQENENKKAIGQGKQLKKKIDIYEALIEEGFDIGYTSVCSAINAINDKAKEAFIKAEYSQGDVCEFDWGDVRLFIAGELKYLQLAVFTTAKSNYRYAVIMPKQNTQCFQESHAKFFEHVGGVFKTMVYDNMKVAVKKFVGLNEKEPTEGLLKLSIYYGFKFRFCNVRRGNEKGHVEKSVEYIRRKAFSNKDNFESVEEANKYLEEVCLRLNKILQTTRDNKSAIELLEMEREGLLQNPPIFDSARIEEPRVDKYSTILIDSCHYSVPDNLVGKKIFVKVYSNRILCFYENEKICEHEKKHGFNEWTIKLEHYLKTLKKKPGALASSLAMKQIDPRLQKIYQDYYIKREREFIELIQLIYEKNLEEILQAIEVLKKINPIDITTEKIKAICNRGEIRKEKGLTNDISSTSEIDKASKRMLNMFSELIPTSNEDFREEVII